MKSAVDLVQNAVSTDAVFWSCDNRISIAAEKSVYILTHKITPSFRDDFFGPARGVLVDQAEHHEDLPVGIDKVAISKLSKNTFAQHRFSLNRLVEPRSSAGFISVKLSPICDASKRSVVACLSQDNSISIYIIDQGHNITKVMDLSSVLHAYAKCRGFHLTDDPGSDQPGMEMTSDFDECQRRVHQLAATGMEWSGIFSASGLETQPRPDVDSAKRQRLDPTRARGREIVLLAASMKSGHIVLWKLECPVQRKSIASVAAVIDVGHKFATAVRWHHPKQECNQRAFLASGGLEGRISIWSVSSQDSETDEIKVSKMLDLWTEEDEIPVQAMVWVDAHCTETSSTLVVVKGLFMMVFQLRTEEGNLAVVHQSHKASLHSALVSGVACFGNVVYTSSTEGSIQKACITRDNGISMDLSLLEPASNMTCRVHGLALSRNGVYLSAVKTHISIPNRVTTSRLHFIVALSEAKIEEVLFDHTGKLCDKFDCLDWLYQRLTLDAALQGIAGTILSEALLADRSREALRYLLKLRRLVAMMLAHKISTKLNEVYGNKRKICEENLIIQEDTVRNSSKQLIKLHVEDCLETHQALMEAQHQNVSGQSSTVSKLMSDWLNMHRAQTDEPTTASNSSVTDKSMDVWETCRLCGEDIPLTSSEMGTCQNGHAWRRCSFTLLLCQTLKPSQCAYCGTPYTTAHSTDSKWLQDILRSDCLFCDGPLYDR